MAIVDARPETASSLSGVIRRLRAMFSGAHENSATNRAAITVFGIRIISAGLAYGSQILLARWMGTSDYGIYVYVWTWVLMLGCVLDFGISPTSPKLIPFYRAQGDLARLRGYQTGARLIPFVAASMICVLLAAIIFWLTPRLDPNMVTPLYLACAMLPAFAVANIQDGMARAYDWMRLALMPAFIIRQVLLIGFAAALAVFGLGIDATTAMLISGAAVWIAMLGQLFPLNKRLKLATPPGPARYDVRSWLVTSFPMLLVESFYLLLFYTDVLMLQWYRPSNEVGVYYAVVKTLILVSFIHYSIAASSAHRFSELYATGDKHRLSAYLSHAIRLTFWPSLIATIGLLIIGKPMLWLFGPQFVEGYGMMFVLAIGLVVRSAVGPIERFLNMAGQQNLCALSYALGFAANVILCTQLIPRFGGYGAAASLSLSLIFLTVVLFVITRWKFGFRVSPFARG